MQRWRMHGPEPSRAGLRATHRGGPKGRPLLAACPSFGPMPQGEMTKLQGMLVSGAATARYAAWLGLDKYLLMELKGLRRGRGRAHGQGNKRHALRAPAAHLCVHGGGLLLPAWGPGPAGRVTAGCLPNPQPSPLLCVRLLQRTVLQGGCPAHARHPGRRV